MVRVGAAPKWLLVGAVALFFGNAPSSAKACNDSAPGIGLAGHRFQQVAITTRDLRRAITFYRDVLGLPLLFEANGMAFFDVAGTRLMIAKDDERPVERPTFVLYFDTPTFTTHFGRLKAAGVALDGPTETVQRSLQGDLRLQQFRDPDGNALAIMGLVANSRDTGSTGGGRETHL